MVIRKYGKAFVFSTTLLLAGLHIGNWVGNDAAFLVQKIDVVGCKILDEDEVLAVAKVALYKSIFDIDLPPIAKKVETLPFVRKAEVSRIFPSTVVITVHERKPVALVNHGGLQPVDGEGVVLPKLQASRRLHSPAMYDIPVLSGANIVNAGENPQLTGVGERLIDFLTALRSKDGMLYHRISELVMNSHGSLVLFMMENGVPVYLGTDGWLEKCDRLSIFLRYVPTSSKKMMAIDLRYENQIVTREG
jgi:cell division septal protein FtsQ